MKLYYPAIFSKETDGQYSVLFPDFPEAITFGDDFIQAIERAKACIELCLEGRIDNGEDIPIAQFERFEAKEKEQIMIIELDWLEYGNKYYN